jgi:CTP synthase
MPFIEALRQLVYKAGSENVCVVQVTLVPTVNKDEEQKTKPTQHAVKELRSLGLSPDIICCRCATPIEAANRAKLANFCQVL